MPIDAKKIRAAVQAVEDQFEADIIGYVGFLVDGEDDRVIDLCRGRVAKRKNVLLILSTPGGSADAAYRIARCIQRSYGVNANNLEDRGSFHLYVHDFCKSAGTLLSLGATHLIMAQRAHLGPIDVQLRKEDEVGERRSGLAPREALVTLAGEAGATFHRLFRQMRLVSLPTKMAAEAATKMAIGILEPIYAQLDPIRLGEIERFVRVAQEYGERLATTNLRSGTIEKLLSGYPSHEFVIDRDEARDLFERVGNPSDDLELVAETFISIHAPNTEGADSHIQYINLELVVSSEEKADAEDQNAGPEPAGAGEASTDGEVRSST